MDNNVISKLSFIIIDSIPTNILVSNVCIIVKYLISIVNTYSFIFQENLIMRSFIWSLYKKITQVMRMQPVISVKKQLNVELRRLGKSVLVRHLCITILK